MIMPYSTWYNPSLSFTVIAKTFKISSKYVALFTQQAALIAQQVPLIAAKEQLNIHVDILNLFNETTTFCSICHLFSVNECECW